MLGVALPSQHRFAEAIKEANKAMAADPRDAWNYGAAGDGYVELGDYARAFDAFDRMGQLQPGPPSYARTAYALELKGDLEGALEYMQRAAEGTSPNDPESQAWHYAQIGDLLLQLGRSARARIEFERADATFPGHPMAVAGLARIRMLDGDLRAARLMLQSQLARTATPDLASAVAELSIALGEATTAISITRWQSKSNAPPGATGSEAPQVLLPDPERSSGVTGGRQPCRRSGANAHRHHDDGHVGVGVFQERSARRREESVRAGVAHGDAQRAYSMSRTNDRGGGYFFGACARRHSSVP